MHPRTITRVLTVTQLMLVLVYGYCVFTNNAPPYPSNFVMSALILTMGLLVASWDRKASNA
jgi:hypothetical protein